MKTRISYRFAENEALGRASLITFVSAGDPDPATSLLLLNSMAQAGADIIELGMPFSDPIADGSAIQASSMRSLKAGINVKKTLDIVSDFRKNNDQTPIILMGYYNPIYIYGVDLFLKDAKSAGVDGLIIVDLPPEEDEELCIPALKVGIDFIHLTTPTSDDARLPKILKNSSGFVYYVSIAGITGTATPDFSQVSKAVTRIKEHTKLPVAVGFGVKNADHAAAIAKCADGVVVGSAIVDVICASLDSDGRATKKTISSVVELVKSLSSAVRSVRKG